MFFQDTLMTMYDYVGLCVTMYDCVRLCGTIMYTEFLEQFKLFQMLN